MRGTRRSRRQNAVADGHPDLARPFHAAMQAAPAAPAAAPPAPSPANAAPEVVDDPWSLRAEAFVATGKRVPRAKPAAPPASRRPRVEALHDLDPRLWPDAGT